MMKRDTSEGEVEEVEEEEERVNDVCVRVWLVVWCVRLSCSVST
jgi:hypothetical protein